ncbi:hypothetical protein TNCV_4968461 [Trichonephila clavipes]|nr:hypothetical protein TNCV_4968461 [Trichonephila clavipes]
MTDGDSRTSFIRTFIRRVKYPNPFLPLERQSLKNAWNKLWPDLEGEKDFNDDHREEITDFVQSIPGFQECDKEDVETWMACDAEDFLNAKNDEI